MGVYDVIWRHAVAISPEDTEKHCSCSNVIQSTYAMAIDLVIIHFLFLSAIHTLSGLLFEKLINDALRLVKLIAGVPGAVFSLPLRRLQRAQVFHRTEDRPQWQHWTPCLFLRS